MTRFRVSAMLTNPTTGAAATVEAVVDTGAPLTTLPPSLVRALGLQPEDTAKIRSPDGRMQDYVAGAVRLTVQGRTRTTSVLFGVSEDTPALLDVATLETMGLTVDPSGQLLIADDPMLLWEGAYADVGTYLRLR